MPKGRTPSLIGSNAGKPKLAFAKRKRQCKRCGEEILMGIKCAEIPIPGSLGFKTICCTCMLEIIKKSYEDLDNIKIQFT